MAAQKMKIVEASKEQMVAVLTDKLAIAAQQVYSAEIDLEIGKKHAMQDMVKASTEQLKRWTKIRNAYQEELKSLE